MSTLEQMSDCAGKAIIDQAQKVVPFSAEFRALVKDLMPLEMMYTWTGQESHDVMMGRLHMRRRMLQRSMNNGASSEFLILERHQLVAIETLLRGCMATQGRTLGV